MISYGNFNLYVGIESERFFSFPHLLEVGHKNAGKGRILKKLLDILGISPENAMAFGDVIDILFFA